MFDAAYRLIFREADIPHSIYENQRSRSVLLSSGFSRPTVSGVRWNAMDSKKTTAATLEGDRIPLVNYGTVVSVLEILWYHASHNLATKSRLQHREYSTDGNVNYYMNNAKICEESWCGLKVAME